MYVQPETPDYLFSDAVNAMLDGSHNRRELAPSIELPRFGHIGGTALRQGLDDADAIFNHFGAKDRLVLAAEKHVFDSYDVSAHTPLLVVARSEVATKVAKKAFMVGVTLGYGLRRDNRHGIWDWNIRALVEGTYHEDPKALEEVLRILPRDVGHARSMAAYIYQLPFDKEQQLGAEASPDIAEAAKRRARVLMNPAEIRDLAIDLTFRQSGVRRENKKALARKLTPQGQKDAKRMVRVVSATRNRIDEHNLAQKI